jgi:membrane protein DedA with SNARE-associated domain
MPFDLAALADAIGYPAAGLGILIESIGLPFPGETTLLAVAAYAAAGHLDIRLVVLLGALGAILGGDLGYLLGYRGGRPFVERFSLRLRLNPGHLARSEMFFTRYGGATILFARFVLGLRTWASVLAGMSRMPFWTFQLYTMLGAVLWALVVGLAGYYVGSNWPLVNRLIRDVGVGGLVAIGVLVTAVLLLRRRAWRIWP